MDQERECIQADLRGLLQGDVLCDDAHVQIYSSDASIYEVAPLGVVRPRNTGDVVACVQYAAEHGIPLHPRGAGSGLAGECLGRGLILDFSVGMRRILNFDGTTARVQSGLTLAALNRWLFAKQRKFGPDPANADVTTVGGMIGVDGAGSRWLAYGSVNTRVKSLQVVLADGQVTEIHKHQTGDTDPQHASPAAQPIVDRLAGLLKSEQQTIESHQPAALVNRSGYALHGILQDDVLDLRRLLTGSEGTLAIITEASLSTDPLPGHEGVALLFFDRLESAARAALEIPDLQATTCDLLDRRLLTLARESHAEYDALIPASAEALLLVEFHDDFGDNLRQRLQQLVHLICRRKRLAFDARIAINDEERELFWRLTRHVVPSLYRLKGSTRPLPFVEDIAVPPSSMPEMLVALQNILKRQQVTASVFAHAGHGQLHIRPFLDLGQPSDVARMQPLAKALYEEVLRYGGTISGEHADGISRSWFLERQYGPLCDVFEQVKQIFDPRGILNPGRIVGPEIPKLTENLRTVLVEQSTLHEGEPEPVESGASDVVPLQLNWSRDEFAYAARSCNGCARCRTSSVDERMCPMFRSSPSEEASPRAKANLMRAILTGNLVASEADTETLKGIADLCFHCHQCRLECPAHVDIPKLMVETKGQYVATNGMRPYEWMFANLDRIASIGSWMRPLVHFAQENDQIRWILEKSLGLAQHRKLPRLASRSFLRRAERRKLTRPQRESGPKVLYFVDIVANRYDVQLADALVRLMEHNGVAVYVHPRQERAGMELIALGILDRARQLAEKNVSVLADAVRQGYQIVTSEPSAALCLKQEYPQLVDDEDALLVAENTTDACAYLWGLHKEGKLELNFRPLNLRVGYHQPCHLKALQVGSPGESLLRLIPGLAVETIEQGCSGMAGTFGLNAENYRTSLRIGRGLMSGVRVPSLHAGTTECSACKMQMEHGTTKPTLHPLKILAWAYGLMPEIGQDVRTTPANNGLR